MSNNICDYGCGEIGLFRKNGRTGIKWSCSENIQHCPAMRDKQRINTTTQVEEHKKNGRYSERRKKILISTYTPDEFGVTSHDKAVVKMLETRKINNSYASGGQKAADTKKNTIDSETGLTLEKLAAQKANATRIAIDETGTSIVQRAGKKLSKTITTIDETGTSIAQRTGKKHSKILTTIDETGTSIAQRAARTRIQMQMSTVNETTGLTLYEMRERAAKWLKPYKNTTLWYGSSYEYKWLEDLEYNNDIDWLLSNVKRGPIFRYYDSNTNTERNYPSDFILNGVVYEIKSSYIFHKTENVRKQTINKLDTVLQKGYQIKLVLDFKEYDWATEKDYILTIV